MVASSETDMLPTQENDELREELEDPRRARITALEGVPVRRIWSAEVGRRQRPKEALIPQTFA